MHPKTQQANLSLITWSPITQTNKSILNDST